MWSTTRLCWRWRLIRRRLRRPRSRKPWSRGCFRSFHVPIAMASWRRTAGAIGQKRKVEAGFKGVIDGRYGQQIMRHTFRHHPASRLRRLGEIALRIALVSSSINHDDFVTVKAMECALMFCEWQEALRYKYRPSDFDD